MQDIIEGYGKAQLTRRKATAALSGTRSMGKPQYISAKTVELIYIYPFHD